MASGRLLKGYCDCSGERKVAAWTKATRVKMKEVGGFSDSYKPRPSPSLALVVSIYLVNT
jgi:hypothetical protein